jgi:hypothetical protein
MDKDKWESIKRAKLTRGSRNPRHDEGKHYKCTNLGEKTQENTRNSQATLKTWHEIMGPYHNKLLHGIDTIIRAIASLFAMFSETPNPISTRNLSKIHLETILTIPSIPILVVVEYGSPPPLWKSKRTKSSI